MWLLFRRVRSNEGRDSKRVSGNLLGNNANFRTGRKWSNERIFLRRDEWQRILVRKFVSLSANSCHLPLAQLLQHYELDKIRVIPTGQLLSDAVAGLVDRRNTYTHQAKLDYEHHGDDFVIVLVAHHRLEFSSGKYSDYIFVQFTNKTPTKPFPSYVQGSHRLSSAYLRVGLSAPPTSRVVTWVVPMSTPWPSHQYALDWLFRSSKRRLPVYGPTTL